jgi:hypothetical protein
MFVKQCTDVRDAAAAVLAGSARLGDLAHRARAVGDGGAHGRAADCAADADVHAGTSRPEDSLVLAEASGR